MPECATFNELCNELIAEHGKSYLYPRVFRTRQTDWIAEIWENDEDSLPGEHLLARGQAGTLEAALQDCRKDYAERARKKARKAELLQVPEVAEAFKLFGVKPAK